MDEQGLRYVIALPVETADYKYKILARFIATLPDGSEIEDNNIYVDGQYAELFTEEDGRLFVSTNEGNISVPLTEDVRWRIGRRIVSLRNKKGITQQQLAEATGLKQPNIVRIEQGLYSTTLDVLERIARALDSTVEIIQNPT